MRSFPGSDRATGARSGFVLLATLWLIIAVAAVSLTLVLAARRALDGSRNRVNERVAYWHSVGCLARASAALDDQLASQPRTTRAQASALFRSIPGCDISVVATAATLDANALTAVQARALAIAGGLSGEEADSAVAAIGSAQFRRFTSDSAIGNRAHTFLRRARLLRFLSVDSVMADPVHSPREIQTVLALADERTAAVATPTAPRPPPDSTDSGEWWIVAASHAGDPPATVIVRAKIVSFGGSFGVKEYRVE